MRRACQQKNWSTENFLACVPLKSVLVDPDDHGQPVANFHSDIPNVSRSSEARRMCFDSGYCQTEHAYSLYASYGDNRINPDVSENASACHARRVNISRTRELDGHLEEDKETLDLSDSFSFLNTALPADESHIQVTQ
jgi:hypothetical protein